MINMDAFKSLCKNYTFNMTDSRDWPKISHCKNDNPVILLQWFWNNWEFARAVAREEKILVNEKLLRLKSRINEKKEKVSKIMEIHAEKFYCKVCKTAWSFINVDEIECSCGTTYVRKMG